MKKSGGGGAVKEEEKLGEKLKRVEFLVGKRGGQTTPILTPAHDTIITTTSTPPPPAPARKLAAAFWELHQYDLPFSKMHQPAALPSLRRHLLQDKSVADDDHHRHRDPSPAAPDLPESASSLRRHVVASLMQHHRSIQRNNNYALQPVSPASYGSSMEMAPYNPAVTPTSSVDFKAGIGETSSYSLKTSTELLKVLNRIWVLEEQHASNVSLVRALKKELDHARSKIKDLVRTQNSDRHQVDDIMKKLAEDKVLRKSKEQDRINSAVQSVREELEDERQLRKRSETLHRKLARELYEVKVSLSNVAKEKERERKSRKVLEDLCDEFALEIRDYAQEVHALKKNHNQGERGDRDRSILHISESWIDERMQMKLESQSEKNALVVEKLSSEIEAFLHSKQGGKNMNHVHNNHDYNNKSDSKVVEKNSNRRSSLESIPLNLIVSAPQHEGDDDDDDDGDDNDEEESLGSDSNCFELNKPQKEEAEEIKILKSKLNRSTVRPPSNLQVKFEEQMAQAAISRNNDDIEEEGQNGAIDRKYEVSEANNKRTKSSSYMENLLRNHYQSSENGNNNRAEIKNSTWRSRASPIRQWTSALPSSSPLENLETLESSKLPRDSQEGTLKSKLIEARTRGQKSRSRLKSSKVQHL